MAYDTIIRLRRDVAADWASVNPVLGVGEAGVETDTRRIKIGDGSTAWNSLLYLAGNIEPEWCMQRADRTLTSTTAEQKIFSASTNGALTLAAGTYEFWCRLLITGMSGTSGNFAFSLVGAGTATLAANEILYSAHGVDLTTATNAGAQVGSMTNQDDSVASVINAAVGTQAAVTLGGVFTLSAGGTIIPSLSLVTGAAATLKKGSHFLCRRLGDHTTAATSAWS